MFKNGKSSAPYVATFQKEISIMKEHLKLEKGKSLVDLGCGDGKALRFFVKNFGIKGFGYDINVFAITLGKILNSYFGFKNSIFLEKKDFMKVDLFKFDYIYLYLFPEQLVLIEDWIWNNMRKSTIIISNSFQFKNHKPFEVINDKKGKGRIFLYRD